MSTPSDGVMVGGSATGGSSVRPRRGGELSYKFQRLRERLRQAVISGELSGKLPGERVLAKRFNCNAKTLSKALTDLAAEGLLERSIGRGTYVKGTTPPASEAGAWLVLGDRSPLASAFFQELLNHNARCQLVVGEPPTRPSFINQFSAVIDVASSTPEPFLRDLIVRGVPVVVVGRESRQLSLDTVLVDVAGGVHRLARELLHLGHRRFVAVESSGRTEVSRGLRNALATWASSVSVDTVAPQEAERAVSMGATAVVCESPAAAAETLALLRGSAVDVPGTVSVAAVGVAMGSEPCSGAYVPLAEVLGQVLRLLEDRTPRRPATLWLMPALVQHGTLQEIDSDASVRPLGPASEPAIPRPHGVTATDN